MRALFDVNVLIALLDGFHTRHAAAHAWWSSSMTHGWATCPLTQNGIVRILSQPSYPARLTILQAMERLAVETARSDHEFWPDDVSLLDPHVIDHRCVLGPKQITDIYLLALAMHHGGRLITFDQAIPIAAVRGAEKRHCVVV